VKTSDATVQKHSGARVNSRRKARAPRCAQM
jgi:hypothetical protein